jgi:hypothetical protein
MKTTLIIILFSFISVSAFSQSDETKKLLASIEGQWQLDENGNVTYQKIVDSLNLTKTEIYNRAMDYFVYNYGDANSVIQNKDVENGIIIGKGIFKSVHTTNAVFLFYKVDTWHILKVEAKDGKARITVSMTQIDLTTSGGDTPDTHVSSLISEQYPLNPKGYQKNIYGKGFYNSHIRALETIASVEKTLRVGGTQKVNDNW